MVCPSRVEASKNHPRPVGVPIEPAAAHAPVLPCDHISPQPVAVPTSTVMAEPDVPPVPVTSWLAVESVVDAAKLFSRTVRAVIDYSSLHSIYRSNAHPVRAAIPARFTAKT